MGRHSLASFTNSVCNYVPPSGGLPPLFIPPFSMVPIVDSVQVENGMLYQVEHQGPIFFRDFVVTANGCIIKNTVGNCQSGPLVIVRYEGTKPKIGQGLGLAPARFAVQIGYPTSVICRGFVGDDSDKLIIGKLVTVTELWGKWKSDVSEGQLGIVLISTGNTTFTSIDDEGSGSEAEDFGSESGSGGGSFCITDVRCVPTDALKDDLVNVGWMNGNPEGYPRTCAVTSGSGSESGGD